MRIGIDSSCYHRYFGEVYGNQKKPDRSMTCADFLKRAAALKVDGVSLETCFFESADESYLKRLREILGKVSSENLGITYDTGNALGIGDDPVKAARKLGRHIIATHTEDVLPLYGGDPQDWFFFGCVPVGRGVIDFPALVKAMTGDGYAGLFAIEIDYPHPDHEDEDASVEESVRYLKKLKI